METTAISVPFTVLSDGAPIALPSDYPELPSNSVSLQPAGYANRTGHSAYVSVLIPVSPGQRVLPIEVVTMNVIDVPGSDERIYNFNCAFYTAVDPQTMQRMLAMIGLEIDSSGVPERAQAQVTVTVNIATDPNDGNVGKVVMDANMLPTEG